MDYPSHCRTKFFGVLEALAVLFALAVVCLGVAATATVWYQIEIGVDAYGFKQKGTIKFSLFGNPKVTIDGDINHEDSSWTSSIWKLDHLHTVFSLISALQLVALVVFCWIAVPLLVGLIVEVYIGNKQYHRIAVTLSIGAVLAMIAAIVLTAVSTGILIRTPKALHDDDFFECQFKDLGYCSSLFGHRRYFNSYFTWGAQEGWFLNFGFALFMCLTLILTLLFAASRRHRVLRGRHPAYLRI